VEARRDHAVHHGVLPGLVVEMHRLVAMHQRR
jgi:hypothetical protein